MRNARAGDPHAAKVRSSMMNAVHDLPLLVARDEGFFRDEGLDVEILKTPGSGQHASDHRALRDDIFDRTLEASLRGRPVRPVPHVRMGHHEARGRIQCRSGHRPAKIVALGSAMSSFAIVIDREVRHLRAGAAARTSRSRQPVQRLAFHHARR